MNKYKIVASDLDGTLLDDDGCVSRENEDAIDALVKKGVHFVISTGRTLCEVPKALADNKNIRYIIFSNGAAVVDRVTDEHIFMCISNSQMNSLMDILEDYDIHLLVRCNGKSYVDAFKQEDEHFERYGVVEAHRRCVRDFALYVNGFFDTVRGFDNVEVLSAFFSDLNDKRECRRRIEALGFLRVVETSEFNIEVMSVEAGKGNGLLALADKLGIDRLDTVSMGDSDNDSSIICAAGLGLAMANSCESLKQMADEVICTNLEHGVKYVLEHYFE